MRIEFRGKIIVTVLAWMLTLWSCAEKKAEEVVVPQEPVSELPVAPAAPVAPEAPVSLEAEQTPAVKSSKPAKKLSPKAHKKSKKAK